MPALVKGMQGACAAPAAALLLRVVVLLASLPAATPVHGVQVRVVQDYTRLSAQIKVCLHLRAAECADDCLEV